MLTAVPGPTPIDRLAARAGAVALLCTLGGCSTLIAAKRAQQQVARLSVMSGEVTTARAPRGPIVVALLSRRGGEWVLVDYFTLRRPGTWVFGVQPGAYSLTAFEDVNGDGTYADEPLLGPDPDRPLVLAPGQRLTGVRLVIPEAVPAAGELVSLSGLKARPRGEQQRNSIYAMSQVGTLADLSDPRFERAVAQRATWDFYDFIVKGWAGIYFLEPYDPDRTPVLFVHGTGGTPRDLAPLIDALDRTRFQPWIAYYPSGGRLEVIAAWLDQLFTRLEAELGFNDAAVVAYSMGGLIARGFILLHQSRDEGTVRTFVSIASPFGGMAAAAGGVAHSPVVVGSWHGLAPGNPFLDGLFWETPEHRTRRRLAADTAYHLLFAFRGRGSSDGVVALASQLRPEAQEDADSLRGYDETHTSIVASPAVAEHVRTLLAADQRLVR